jgi:hypothetical protein
MLALVRLSTLDEPADRVVVEGSGASGDREPRDDESNDGERCIERRELVQVGVVKEDQDEERDRGGDDQGSKRVGHPADTHQAPRYQAGELRPRCARFHLVAIHTDCASWCKRSPAGADHM